MSRVASASMAKTLDALLATVELLGMNLELADAT